MLHRPPGQTASPLAGEQALNRFASDETKLHIAERWNQMDFDDVFVMVLCRVLNRGQHIR
jgi:hypothetical protein